MSVDRNVINQLAPTGTLRAAINLSNTLLVTRFHGVFSPRSKLRAHVVPGKPEDESEQVSQSTRGKTYSMTWAQRLKRVFENRQYKPHFSKNGLVW